MPPAEPQQEALPDFATHPEYQQFFEFLVDGGQTRDQATTLLTDIWLQRVNGSVHPQHAMPPQPDHQVPQPEQADLNQPDQPRREQPPLEPQPLINQPGGQHLDLHRDQEFMQPPPQELLLPQDFPQPPCYVSLYLASKLSLSLCLTYFPFRLTQLSVTLGCFSALAGRLLTH